MPYADPEKARQANREWRRKKRQQVIVETDGQNFCQPLLPAPAVADVVALLADELNRVRRLSADSICRGRAVAHIAATLVDCLKSSHIEQRIAALESTLKGKTNAIELRTQN